MNIMDPDEISNNNVNKNPINKNSNQNKIVNEKSNEVSVPANNNNGRNSVSNGQLIRADNSSALTNPGDSVNNTTNYQVSVNAMNKKTNAISYIFIFIPISF